MNLSIYLKHKQSIKSAGWGIAGLIVSISIIQAGRFSLFGYPLLILSLLMFLLAGKQFFKEKYLNYFRFKRK